MENYDKDLEYHKIIINRVSELTSTLLLDENSIFDLLPHLKSDIPFEYEK